MADWKDSGYFGQVVWLGHVPAGGSLRAEPRESLDLVFGGAAATRHFGDRRRSCSRVLNLYPKGSEITNTRQLSLLSAEEMGAIALAMGLGQLDPALIGASVVLQGIPDFSHVPPASRLQGPSGVTLTVDVENAPCVLPGRQIEQDAPGFGAAFKSAARGRRGVTAWVERPGALAIGDRLALFVPNQRAWAP